MRVRRQLAFIVGQSLSSDEGRPIRDRLFVCLFLFRETLTIFSVDSPFTPTVSPTIIRYGTLLLCSFS